MTFILSNYGLRLLQHFQQNPTDASLLSPELFSYKDILSEFKNKGFLPQSSISQFQNLLDAGLIQENTENLQIDDIILRYQRNPLENFKRLTFEYTTLCNLSCSHCRNGNLVPVTERNLQSLKRTVDVVIPMGIKRFDFIGGEVLLYGMKWPELAEHIHSYSDEHHKMAVNMLTSGWFLEQEHFWAAGCRYENDLAFLEDIKSKGVTHLTFSLDGPAQIHNLVRKVDGLYERILQSLERIRNIGLIPQFSLLRLPQISEENYYQWQQELSNALYPHLPIEQRLLFLYKDDMNYMSHFVDVGNGSQLFEGDASEFEEQHIRCKNFFRPSPTLRLKATGEISLCPLIEAGDGYGNVHQTDILELLNSFQDVFAYRLHAENKIVDYKHLLDRELFEAFNHICSYRVVLTMLAQEIHKAGYDETNVPSDLCRELNIKVARRSGFLASDKPSPLGRTAPR